MVDRVNAAFLASTCLFECMHLTPSGKTKKEVYTYEKVCAYKKGALKNPSLSYTYSFLEIRCPDA